MSGTLESLVIDNRFTRDLPADPDTSVGPRQVPGASFSRVKPKTASDPHVVAVSDEVAELLGIDRNLVSDGAIAEVFSGNRLLSGMDPFAMNYGGHQFGSWAGQLGDGRAIALGEVLDVDGGHQTLQLKGAGPTPYSRTADGLAVLRSSVREFLCSEAMHHLGVPTTRALSLVTTGDKVMRDMLYDGHPGLELGAVVSRVAPSFTRFGNFQLPAVRGELDVLRRMVDYTIRNDFPHLGEPSPETEDAWFAEVATRTAEMIVHWMRVGFVHGVMNTDNMSILGLTIDYGPYGWLEDYDPDWTPNTTDAGAKRYRYGYQPAIAHWNLAQLANAIYTLTDRKEPLEAALETYANTFESGYNAMMAAKLGFAGHEPDGDLGIHAELTKVLRAAETDMTLFYRGLANVPATASGALEASDDTLLMPLADAYYQPEQLTQDVRAQVAGWLRSWQARVRRDGTPDAVRAERMNEVNPKYVLRNYLAQLAIDKATDDDNSMVVELLDVLRRPYTDQPGKDEFAAKRPDWARSRPGCSMLSCSS